MRVAGAVELAGAARCTLDSLAGATGLTGACGCTRIRAAGGAVSALDQDDLQRTGPVDPLDAVEFDVAGG
jgi:hypothetical protein